MPQQIFIGERLISICISMRFGLIEFKYRFDRLSYVYASYMRPKWTCQVQLADLMVSLGFIKAALDVYLAVEHWDAVIACYNALDLKHKVSKIIQADE